MLFSRKKKQQRDRDAGLVFCWRGQGGNRGGLILALLIASGIYAAAFWGLSLSFKSTPSEPNQSAKILLLDDLSSEMALWVDQNSPFPVRWDPQRDSAHEGRVLAALDETLQSMTSPMSPWRKMPELPESVSTPRLIEAGSVQLGNLPEVELTNDDVKYLELTVVMDAFGDFRKRLPAEVGDLGVSIPKQEYGSSLRFAVTLNALGEVIFCAPVDWESSDYARGIENWVRVQKFRPLKGRAADVGEITIRVEAKNHVGN